MGLSTSKKAIGAHSISGIPHTSMGTLVLRIWALEIIWYLVWMLRAKVLCVDPTGDAESYWEARGFDPFSWEKFVPARTAEESPQPPTLLTSVTRTHSSGYCQTFPLPQVW